MRVGIRVQCKVCGRMKAPHGRSVADLMHGAYCEDECKGYDAEPLPGCLWPGETAVDFGYAHCLNATEDAEVIHVAGEKGEAE